MPRVARPTIRRCPWKQGRWIVDGLRDDQGKRFRKFFESREAAKTWLANHREKSLVEGRSGLSFTDAQRADARRALLELAPLKGATLTDAARHYADFVRRIERTVPVSELVATFITAKHDDGRSSRYLADLRCRLGDFSEAFGDKPAAGVSTRDLDDWLRGLPVGPQSRVNYRRVLHALFNFAVAREYARDNPVVRTERPKVFAKEPGILTAAQMDRLLANADATLRASLAIGAFAGLRPAEIHRLTWDAVNLEERLISVSAKASKTASRRLVPICDNLFAWLLRAPKRTGLVMPLSVGDERILTLAARKAAGIKNWPSDALRHSWVTYRFTTCEMHRYLLAVMRRDVGKERLALGTCQLNLAILAIRGVTVDASQVAVRRHVQIDAAQSRGGNWKCLGFLIEHSFCQQAFKERLNFAVFDLSRFGAQGGGKPK